MRFTSKFGLLAVASAICLTGNVRVFADDKLDIGNTYITATNALKKKDMKGFLKTYTDDFVMIASDGTKLNWGAMKAQLETQFNADVNVDIFDMKMLSCRITGKTARATSLSNMKIHGMGPDGKPMVMESTDKADDTLVKTPKGWKFKSSKSLKTTMSVNGKVIDMSKLAPPPLAKKK
ncbi:MAG: nuclear transport factor 2 family protein [Chthonomonadales bacterium]